MKKKGRQRKKWDRDRVRAKRKKRELVKGTRERGAKSGSRLWQGEDAWRITPPAGGRRSPRRGKAAQPSKT